jgi:DNA topoisomerase-1
LREAVFHADLTDHAPGQGDQRCNLGGQRSQAEEPGRAALRGTERNSLPSRSRARHARHARRRGWLRAASWELAAPGHCVSADEAIVHAMPPPPPHHPNRQKFFGSFFQKRTTFLFPPATVRPARCSPGMSELTPQDAARAARLRYVSDSKPGITRKAVREGWAYFQPDGRKITDEAVIDRIRKLAIPPAYRDVWICPYANGHIQAVGRDARGRKQYRYHAKWRETRDEAKFAHMLTFGRVLPQIRARVEQDLSLPGLKREKVLAAVVRLLERTLVRIGNEEYARTNKSFGLTTLRRRHVKVKGVGVTFDFRAKHGIQWHVELKDRRLSKIIARLNDLRGQELFQYLDDDGEVHGVTSDDVNDYLRDITGEDITAKDFRTWAATNLAAVALAELEAFDTRAKAKKNVLRAVEAVAKMLGNTPSICRKCYIHPAIFDAYLDGSLLEGIKARADAVLAQHGAGLSAEEVAVAAFLDRRLARVGEKRAA